MNNNNSTPLKIKLIYALGQFGWSLCYYAISTLLITFYFPPETDSQYNFPLFIDNKLLFGFITILGLITLSSRLFDAIIDPIIANRSDNYNGKLGKRKPFLLFSALPLALFSFLVFYPIATNSFANAVWLAFTLFGFYFFMTLYTVPYTAWMSELGKTQKERLNISTLISVTWALGFAFGNFIHLAVAHFEKTYSTLLSFQISVGIFAVISLIFMLLPAIFIDEKKYSTYQKSDLKTFASLKQVWQNKNFKTFVISDLFYWMALMSIQTGIVYYVTVLLQQPKESITNYLTVMFLVSFVLYYPVNILSQKLGRKALISFAFLIFMLVFLATYFVNGNTATNLFYVIIIFAAIPMAIFGILPNAIIADEAHNDFEQSNQNKTAMYFGLRMFMMKIGIAFTTFIFPSLLYFGKSVDNDFGIRLTLLFAVAVCAIGFLIFQLYKVK